MQGGFEIMKTLATLLTTLLALPLAVAATGSAGFRVFYYPMYANTYEVVTSEGIEGQFDLTSLLKNKRKELRAILENRDEEPTRFGKNFIRVKITGLYSTDVLVDLNRNVKSGDRLSRLSPFHYKQLFLLIKSSLPEDMSSGD